MKATAKVEAAEWGWTWGELKGLVASTGATDETVISWIDISNNGFSNDVMVVRDEYDRLEIH